MLNVEELIKATKGNLINGSDKIIPKSYEIDSRNIKVGDFFVPIKGNRQDAHQYILECIKKGAIGYFINKDYYKKNIVVQETKRINSDVIIIEVEDTLNALIEAGKYNRQKHIEIPVVAVTGSVGKTSTREMIASVLREEKNVLVTKKNYNSNIGTSLMCLEIDHQDVCVLEAGIDKFNEMDEISEILKPDIVVITMIGTAHIGTFQTKENIFLEKAKLINYIQGIKTVIVNGDDEYLSKLSPNERFHVEKISVDNVDNVETFENSLVFESRIYGDKLKITINQIGDHNIYNCLMAIQVAQLFQLKKENIIQGIANYKNFKGRLEKIEINGITIIDDTYNASGESMRSGLITVNRLKANRKFAILGDALDLGIKADEIHAKIAEVFSITKYDYLFTIGVKANIISNYAKNYLKEERIKHFSNNEDLITTLLKLIKKGDILYFKASNAMHFDKLIEQIKEKLS